MSSYTSSSSSRRRVATSSYLEENAVLDRISREAEERQERKRQAREEARQIRMDCLEKSIKANDQKDYHLIDNNNSERVTELENKFQRAMLLYSQLDNEKSALLYEIDLLKDEMEEKDQSMFQVTKENREISEELKLLRKTVEALQLQHQQFKNEIQQRDRLIHEHGFIIAEQDPSDEILAPTAALSTSNISEASSVPSTPKFDPILLSHATLSAIEKTLPGTSSIDQKIQRLVESNRKLRQQMDESEKALYNRRQRNDYHNSSALSNSEEQLQRDAVKQLGELKLKLQETEREKSAMEASLSRAETQMKRYKTNAEQAEKEAEETQKMNRQLKNELRAKEQALDESKETNNHLQSRLEKLRNSRRPI